MIAETVGVTVPSQRDAARILRYRLTKVIVTPVKP